MTTPVAPTFSWDWCPDAFIYAPSLVVGSATLTDVVTAVKYVLVATDASASPTLTQRIGGTVQLGPPPTDGSFTAAPSLTAAEVAAWVAAALGPQLVQLQANLTNQLTARRNPPSIMAPPWLPAPPVMPTPTPVVAAPVSPTTGS